ncbi:hypothetical protein GCM10007301_54910 [Azorhizobium oxalatiphilum]|uniref:Uncharacterized protein n=2 Tax=Azorhizobium oxalatiphilum TaxID=980631 RepID=A0A917CG55_9HYPH|nr:hypothetical protein GCM10007301_54910 [Azorhizobium oxalatiphilum]
MVVWFPILAWALALFSATFSIQRAHQWRNFPFICERLLAELLLFPVGLLGLWAALGHIVFANQAAAAIGWAPSPFQTEVGLANLGIGIAGLIGYVYRDWGYRLGVSLVTGVFLLGAAAGHIYQMYLTGNLAPGNAGPILYTDVLTPLALFILLAITRRAARDVIDE